MRKDLEQCSKFLSLVLRHKPEALGLTLDENGWVDVEQLLAAANKQGKEWTIDLINETVSTNDKQRFSISDDGKRIRANQGHSLKNVELELKPKEPPRILYHGTVDRFLEAIKRKGLQKMNRQHVHLSSDIETAQNVGGRRGKPVILEIASKEMFLDSNQFFLSENGVWLTEQVPAKYIRFP